MYCMQFDWKYVRFVQNQKHRHGTLWKLSLNTSVEYHEYKHENKTWYSNGDEIRLTVELFNYLCRTSNEIMSKLLKGD